MKALIYNLLFLAFSINTMAQVPPTPQPFQTKGGDQYGFLLGRKCIVPARYDSVWRFSEGLAAVKSGDGWGYIDLTGKLVLPHQYDQAYPFENQMAIVAVDGRFGVIDPAGDWVLEPTYQQVFPYDSDRFQVRLAGQNGIIDRHGNWLLPARYEYIDPPSENRIHVQGTLGFTGYLDTRFAPAIPFRFHCGGDFTEGLAKAHGGADGWGYIDTSGAWHIAPRFLSASPFQGGYAVVAEGRFEPSYGIIDRNGDNVLSPRWTHIDARGGPPYLATYKDQFSFFLPPDTLPIMAGLDGAEVFIGDYAFVCKGCRLSQGEGHNAWQEGRWALMDMEGRLYELPKHHHQRTRLNQQGLGIWNKAIVTQWQQDWLRHAKLVEPGAFRWVISQ